MIKYSQERISFGLAEKSFRKCGISNSLDGSEGDFIQYSDDSSTSPADDNDSDKSSGE
jgi:hypothetical protein